MKNSNYPLIAFSFIFSLIISAIFSIFSYFYVQESIKTLQAQGKEDVTCYGNRILHKVNSVEELKNEIFGTTESFVCRIGIFDNESHEIYSSFEKRPKYNMYQKTYVQENKVFFNDHKIFPNIGEVRVIFRKDLNFSIIETKIKTLAFGIVIFFILCFSTLYLVLIRLYSNINKNFNIFFRNAIHEIRTPLGVLQINLEFLENVMEDSKALKRARGGLNNLTNVYETIEYHIKYKRIKFPREKINLSEFLKNRLDFFKILAEIKEIKLETSIENNIYMQISRMELQRLIDNNLSNAIKYSKENTIIEVKLQIIEESIILIFTNQGEQIPDVDNIFKRYYRGNDIKGGFGLGLDIVKYICNLYNIKIAVKSDGNKNSFLYKIPNKLNKEAKND